VRGGGGGGGGVWGGGRVWGCGKWGGGGGCGGGGGFIVGVLVTVFVPLCCFLLGLRFPFIRSTRKQQAVLLSNIFLACFPKENFIPLPPWSPLAPGRRRETFISYYHAWAECITTISK